MEHQLEAWLKTYRGETLISPAQWAELPKECSIKLDHYARDEAVRRADEFARDGQLDLDRQDAIRQLVDSMAQCWMLPAEPVRRLVEDFLDQQPAKPGFEFEKTTTKLFRRRVNGTWKELLDMIDYKNEPKILSVVVDHLDIDRRKNTDRTQFLNAWREGYDAWTLAEPKDCVAELIATAASAESGGVNLREILPLIKHRGGHSWAKAIELELEVGVEQASRDDLIRMLRRYSLIVKRERSAAPKPAKAEPEFMPVDDEPLSAVEEVIAEEVEPESEVEAAAEPEVAPEIEVEEVEVTEVEEVEPEPEEEEVEVEAVEEAELEPEETTEYDELTEEDRDAAEELFGEEGEGEETVEFDAESEEEAPAPEVEEVEEEEEDEPEVEAEEKPEVEAVPEPEQEAPADEGKTRLKDVFTPSPVKDRVDRFANIRSGPLRDKVVSEMYKGDETLLDVFLAKLSGAPDWNRAKQFIANEFFRCKVDLHSELGQELFLQLKESLDV